jgi:hypothetical protein
MSEITFVDKTGKLGSMIELERSIGIIGRYITTGLLSLPPELMVELPAVHRQLKELMTIRKLIEEAEKKAHGS